jgi:plastocyanin
LHSEPLFSDKVVVNDNGTLKNVFVYVKEGLGDQTFAPPAEPVVFDQEGCHYEPHVFGIQVGQTLKVLNSDPFLHNVNVMAEENRGFNLGMPNQGDERERDFRVPEIMVHIKCDVHAWMEAYAGVVPHPFFDTSGEDGTFSLNNLPAGTYVIEAWHEEYGTTTQSVTVTDGASAAADFTFNATS